MSLIIKAAKKLIQSRKGETSNKQPMKKLTQSQKDKLKASLKKVATNYGKSGSGSPSGQKAPVQKSNPSGSGKPASPSSWDDPLDLGFVKTTRKKAAIGAGVTLVVGAIAYKAIKRK